MKKVIGISLTLVLCGAITLGNISYMQSVNKVTKVDIHNSHPFYDLEDLTNKADLIVRGVVNDITKDKWNNKENRKPKKLTGDDIIYKDNLIKVNKVLKNTSNSSNINDVKVRTYSGTVEGFIMSDDSQYAFNKGEEVILFLQVDDSVYNEDKSTAHFVVIGGLQGVYKSNGTNKFKNVHEDLDEADLKSNVEKYISNPKKYPPFESVEN